MRKDNLNYKYANGTHVYYFNKNNELMSGKIICPYKPYDLHYEIERDEKYKTPVTFITEFGHIRDMVDEDRVELYNEKGLKEIQKTAKNIFDKFIEHQKYLERNAKKTAEELVERKKKMLAMKHEEN